MLIRDPPFHGCFGKVVPECDVAVRLRELGEGFETLDFAEPVVVQVQFLERCQSFESTDLWDQVLSERQCLLSNAMQGVAVSSC